MTDSGSSLGFHDYLLQGWAWLLIAGVVGGLFGLAAGQLAPSLYRAEAVINVGIDYGRTAFLDEDGERHVMSRVQEVILAGPTLTGALSRLDPAISARSDLPTELQLREAVELTRVGSRWTLAVTLPSAEIASALANAWAESALAELEEAREQAWRSAELQRIFFRVACRPEVRPRSPYEGFWICDEYDPEGRPGELTEDLFQAVDRSRGIIPGVSLGMSQPAVPADRPVTAARPAMAVAGVLLGMLTGIGTLALVRRREVPLT